MAYKFQLGEALMSGSLVQQGSFELEDDNGTRRFSIDRDTGAISSSWGSTFAGPATFSTTLAVTGAVSSAAAITAGTSFIIGSADLNETDMEKIDGITNGTAAAAKAVVLDASKNIATLGTVGCGAITSTGASGFGAGTFSGILKSDDATDATSKTDGSLQTDGGLSVAKAIYNGTAATFAADSGIVTMGAATALTVSAAGLLNVNNATDATSATDGSLQTDGGLSVVKDAIMGNDVKLLSDSAVLSLGAGSDATFTHDGTTGLTIAAAPLILSSTSDVTLDSVAGDVVMADNGTPQIKFDLDSDATGPVIQLQVDSDDLVFKQFDGTEVFRINDDATAAVAVGLMPDANDGAYLGQAGTAFSDLFLAEGGVINWDSGDLTMTQTENVLAVAGGTLTATLTNALSKAANSGLAMTSFNGSAAVSDLAFDLNALAAVAVDVAADSIAILDATDSSSKKESIADLVAAMAGSGLSATNGVLSAQGSGDSISVAIVADSGTMGAGLNYTATQGGAITVSLPAVAGPQDGDIITLKANSGTSPTNKITVNCDTGDKIDGVTNGTIILESVDSALQFIYIHATTNWALV